MISNDRFRMLPTYHYEDATDETLLKSVGKPLRDYRIEGNSVQEGYENLWVRMPEQTKNGVTLTIDRMGVYHLNGTCTTTFVFSISTPILPAGDYCLLDYAVGNFNDGSGDFRVQICTYDSDGNLLTYQGTVVASSSDVCVKYTIPDTATGMVQRIKCRAGHTYNDCTLNPTLIAGSEIPKPSPSNPIEIESVGEKSVNIVDYSKLQTVTSWGVTFKNNNDGTFTANGMMTSTTPTYNLLPAIDLNNFVVGKTYYASCGNDYADSEKRYYLFFQMSNSETGTNRYWSSYSTNSFTLLENETITAIQIRIYAIPPTELFEVSNLVFSPMICKAEEYNGFEPYGKYKIPVTISGKNLIALDDVEKTFSGVTVKSEKATQNITVTGVAIGDGGRLNKLAEITLEAGRYFFSSTSDMPRPALSNKANNGVIAWSNSPFTLTETTTIILGVNVASGVTYNNSISVQIEEGSTATSYEPYHEPKTYNIFLDEPLRKVGDYADYVDFKNGKVVRYVRTMNLYELDDRYVIKNYTYGNNFDNTYHFNCYMVSASNLEDICVAETDMYCNILPAGNLGMNYLETDSFFTSLYTAARYPWYAQIEKALIDSYSGDTIVDKFKAFLTDKKAELYYCRQNYGETPISLPKILTEKGTNIITIGTKLQPSIVTYQYYKGGK